MLDNQSLGCFPPFFLPPREPRAPPIASLIVPQKLPWPPGRAHFFCFCSWWPSAVFPKNQLFPKKTFFPTFSGSWPFWASFLAPWVPPGRHFGTILGTKMQNFGSKKRCEKVISFYVVFNVFLSLFRKAFWRGFVFWIFKF